MRTGSHVNALFKGTARGGVRLVRRLRLAAADLDGGQAGGAAHPGGLPLRRAAPHPHPPGARPPCWRPPLAPNLTARFLELVNRFLPAPADSDGEEAQPGWQHSSRWVPSALTRLADEAAVENNELRGEAVGYGKA